MSRWYRAYEGTVTDAKLGEVALVVECSRSVAIAAWHAILESCAGVNNGGKFDTTPRRVAVILSEPIKTIEAVFAGMVKQELISADSVNSWKQKYASKRRRCWSPVWVALREFVFKRDGFTCQYCGSKGVRLECDHIHPVSKGGDDIIENLTTACVPCNRSKRDKTLAEWLA